MKSLAGNITDIILETFRLNGELLTSGDRLMDDLSLTSARWQVLGAIAMSSAPLPVVQIARNMGLSRQSVQRLVNEMTAQELTVFEANPHHRRAKLVVMTLKGQAVFDTAMDRQRPWADGLAEGLTEEELDGVFKVLRNLRLKLQTQNDLKITEDQHVEEFA